MNAAEVASLCALVKASGSGQVFNEHTVLAWTKILGDVDAQTAVDAVVRLKQAPGRFPTISTEDIFGMIRTMASEQTGREVDRSARVVPNVDPDRVGAYLAEHKAIVSAISSGDFPHEEYAEGGWTMTGAMPLRAAGELESAEQWSGESPRAIDAAVMARIFRRPPRATRDNFLNPIPVEPHAPREASTEAVVVSESQVGIPEAPEVS